MSRSLTFEEACFYDNVGDILAAPTRVEPGAGREAVRRGKLPDPALPEVGSPSVREGVSGQSYDERVTDEIPDTSNGGGSLPGSQHFGGGVELFSSEGNSSFEGGEVVEMSCSTRWRHPVGLPRAEPMQSRAQVL